MLVQPRSSVLRLVRQHDHALLSGALAGAWRAPPAPAGLAWSTVVATSLHDVVWREEDAAPRLDPSTGRPYDFSSLPPGVKGPMVEAGLARLEAVDPPIGALVREHHQALREERAPGGEAGWIRFFDALSLYVCLTPPGADPEEVPDWLKPEILRPPGDGQPLSPSWEDPHTLRLEPFPLAGDALEVAVPYRDLPRRRYPDAGALLETWRGAAPGTWTVRLVR